MKNRQLFLILEDINYKNETRRTVVEKIFLRLENAEKCLKEYENTEYSKYHLSVSHVDDELEFLCDMGEHALMESDFVRHLYR